MSFDPKSFDNISSTLTKKYGKSKITNSTVTNAMGASFNQIERHWNIKNSEMYLRKYADKISEGVLYIVSKDYLKTLEEKLK